MNRKACERHSLISALVKRSAGYYKGKRALAFEFSLLSAILMAFTRRDAVVLGLALLLPTFITWIYFVALASAPAAVQQAAYAVGKLAQFALPVVYVYLIRGQLRPGFGDDDSPRSPRRLASVASGIAFGAVVMLTGWLAYRFLLAPWGLFTEPQAAVLTKVRGLQLASPTAYIFLAVFYSGGHAFLEEYYWRWFVYRECRRAMRQPAAVLVSSLGFMAHHVLVVATYFGWASPLTYLLCAAVAIGGAFWAWLYERYGTLLGPWLSHLLIDAMIFFVGYDLIFHR